MSETVYWLWLQQCIGFIRSYKEVLDVFTTPRELYEADPEMKKESPYLRNKKALRDVLNSTDLTEAENTVKLCSEHGIHILTPESDAYPERLRAISCPPTVLFVRGDVQCLKNEFPVAVIGSRTPCKYGEKSARDIVSGLVKGKNALIVSGGALGIDSVAHSTALENNGKTVLVLGHGHGYKYLPENKEMRMKVFRNGAIVTEYPPYTPITQGSFPRRNRIISGLSKGVVIIEAAEYSGTFSTAKHAEKQGRELFVLPGDIESGNFAGSNNLIIDGAAPIFSAADVIAYYDGDSKSDRHFTLKNNTPFEGIDVDSEFSKKTAVKSGNKASKKKKLSTKETPAAEKITEKEENKIKNLPETISKNAEIVYNLMSDGKCTLDELARSSSLLPAKILAALTELELEGIAAKTADAYRLV